MFDLRALALNLTELARQLDGVKDLFLFDANQLVIKRGSASVTLKKDGTITIQGKDIFIEGNGKVRIKAAGDVELRGSRITQN